MQPNRASRRAIIEIDINEVGQGSEPRTSSRQSIARTSQHRQGSLDQCAARHGTSATEQGSLDSGSLNPHASQQESLNPSSAGTGSLDPGSLDQRAARPEARSIAFLNESQLIVSATGPGSSSSGWRPPNLDEFVNGPLFNAGGSTDDVDVEAARDPKRRKLLHQASRRVAGRGTADQELIISLSNELDSALWEAIRRQLNSSEATAREAHSRFQVQMEVQRQLMLPPSTTPASSSSKMHNQFAIPLKNYGFLLLTKLVRTAAPQ
jgi:hypothetical protein